MASEDRYWKDEILLYKKQRGKRDPFAHYYPEKTASLILLVDYFSRLVDLRVSKIMEVGMGSGMALILAAMKGADCTGVDISKEACRFTKILREDYLSRTQKRRLRIINKDIFSYDTSEKFDLVFSIGSLEHLGEDRQLKFLLKMKNLSQKYILIGVPDYQSPVFKSFMWYFSKQNRVYEERHLPINVKHLFKSADITFVDKVGMGIGISGKHINKENHTLRSFLIRKFKIKDLYNLVISADKVDWLVDIEKSLSKEEADTYGFIDLFVGVV